MNIMDLSIYNADISVTFILFMRPLTCKIIDFVELSSVELRSYKTVLLLSLFLVKFKLFVYFTFIESELDVNLSINSVLGEEEKKEKRMNPSAYCTPILQVLECAKSWFPNQGDSILSISNWGQDPNYMRQYGNLSSSSSVFVQVCLNVCIGNNGTVTTQYLQK